MQQPPKGPEKKSRREFLRIGTKRGSATASAPTSGTATAASARAGTATPFAGDPAQANLPPLSPWTDARIRLVRRTTYGPRASDVADVKTMGYQRWLNDQVNFTRIDNSALDADVAARWPNLSRSPGDLAMLDNGTLRNELASSTMYRAVFSKRQLFERMVEFWTDHFSIDWNKVGYLKMVDDREVIRKHALGNFGDMLKASAKSPAMLAYLDQNLSRVGAPNQNYARELMELHTLGVDGGYTQQDVEELSRVLTGWTVTGGGQFTFNAARHDFGAKTVLGVSIPATSPSIGAEGVKEGERMLDVLLKHPSTGRFLATKLLKWFVTPEPTAAQIEAVAGAYRATNGDIKRMVRATLNEGWIAQAPLKLKRPYHLVVSSLRNTSAIVVSLQNAVNTTSSLGQALFQWETPDGFPDLMEYWAGNLTPRWSYLTALANSTSTTSFRVSVAPYLAGTPDAALDMMNSELFSGEMAATTRAQLRAYLVGGTFNETRVRETLGLALCSHEFQWF
jgi:uncharacterized protein (DUF1800 family)